MKKKMKEREIDVLVRVVHDSFYTLWEIHSDLGFFIILIKKKKITQIITWEVEAPLFTNCK